MCPRCGRAVYAAEKVIGGGNVSKISALLVNFGVMNCVLKLIQQHLSELRYREQFTIEAVKRQLIVDRYYLSVL